MSMRIPPLSMPSERKDEPEQPSGLRSAVLILCTPGTGVNLWGVSPLYVNPVNVQTLTKVLAKGKGGTVRDRPKEARVQSYEPSLP
ncbi:MAG: hypothetical protein ABFD75_11435 [Smithella sp.]